MAKKRIVVIGFELNEDDVEHFEFDSGRSLLDWDIILFKPEISHYLTSDESYLGKPRLTDYDSFKLKEYSEHWHREIKDAVDAGKTVFVFQSDLRTVYIDTGRREFSGTGRNQKTTHIVEEYDNYKCLPLSVKQINTSGSEMKLTQKGSILGSYWQAFESLSNFQVILTGMSVPSLIVTKNGDKPVAAIYQNKNSAGSIFLLPDIDFYCDKFFVEEEDDLEWNPEAHQFAANLIKEVVALDKAAKNEGKATPAPDWSQGVEFELEIENKIKVELLKIETKLEKLQKDKNKINDQLKDSGRLRNLLYETGKPLEFAIIDALLILGFEVGQYQDNESEFDVVFECKEGRLIGEAEGKDNKAINITKLRQLEMNILEDLERENVDAPAKAVLFGNAQRLLPLSERTQPFTQKCLSAASRSQTALLSTPDLFTVAQYLSNKNDKRFATQCRKTLLAAVGIVNFPSVPVKIVKVQEGQQSKA